jgi:hypothetical protein
MTKNEAKPEIVKMIKSMEKDIQQRVDIEKLGISLDIPYKYIDEILLDIESEGLIEINHGIGTVRIITVRQYK